MKTKLLIFFILFLGTGTVHAQRFSLALNSTIDYTKVSPSSLSGLANPQNSLGSSLGIYYELAFNRFSIEAGLNFGYGRLKHITTLNADEFNVPWDTFIDFPEHFVKGFIPVNIVFYRSINANYRAIFKGGIFYQSIYLTDPFTKYSIGDGYNSIEHYKFVHKDELSHSIGNIISAGIGRKLSKGSELQLHLVFGFTYEKPVEGEIIIMPETSEEQKGTVYKTGQSLGLEIRYCFNKK